MAAAIAEGKGSRLRGTTALAWAVCLAMTLLAAAVPFLRAFYRVEIDYNEGWNIYNAATVAAHGWLYPAQYGWTSVNYPMLSFVLMAALHRLTHEYLFTARVVSLISLLANGLLTGLIVYRLAGSRAKGPAIFAGIFVVAMSCANADYYVGMDDPQMLAQVFFLAGLYVHVSQRSSLVAILAAAALFVLGGFIKHNPIDFPLAVLIDLALISRWRAVWFSVCGLLLVGIGLTMNIHYGGPHFIDQLLAPRTWSLAKASRQLLIGLGPILLPVGAAIYMAWKLRGDPTRRIVAILFAASLSLGGYFGGGTGVAVNALFSAMLSVAMLLGLLLAQSVPTPAKSLPTPLEPRGDLAGRSVLDAETLSASLFFVWLLIPLAISGNLNPWGVMHTTRAAEARFDRQVAVIAAHPGPALCESLLRCYAAGKPYVYDPFNATRLVKLGKLNQDVLLRDLDDQNYKVIQLGVALGDDAKIDAVDTGIRDRFTPEALAAIQRNYVLAMQDADVAIYLPAAR